LDLALVGSLITVFSFVFLFCLFMLGGLLACLFGGLICMFVVGYLLDWFGVLLWVIVCL